VFHGGFTGATTASVEADSDASKDESDDDDVVVGVVVAVVVIVLCCCCAYGGYRYTQRQQTAFAKTPQTFENPTSVRCASTSQLCGAM